MADKRISQLIERTDIANNDVLPIVANGATTTNKVTISTIQDWMQDNLDVGVTSVGLSVPSAFTVSGSPVTTSGNITISGAGTTAQYIRGDGSLADFPSSLGGGGASVSYYLNGSVNQGTIGGVAYRELSKSPILGAGTDFTINADGYIASFITDAGDPSLLEIPGGNWNFETYFQASSGGGSPTFYVELYKVSAAGTATLIATSSGSPELIAFGTNITPYFSSLAVPTTTLALTDRLAIRYYVTPAGRTITLHTENNTLCQIITTFTTGLTALNGLTAQVQNFATGTSGTDFNISSASTTHTFNLPDASASNRGAVTTGSQVFGGVKTFANGLSLPSAGGSNQVTRLVNIGTLHEGSATLNQIGFNSANNIYFGKGLSNGGVLQWTNSAVRYYTFPDADGTLALASQLGAYLPLAGGTLTGALNGTSAVFSGDVQSGTRLIAAASSQSILLTPNSGGTTNRVESVGTLPLALVSAAAITMAAGGTTPQITLATNGAVTLTGALGGASASFTGNISAIGNSSMITVSYADIDTGNNRGLRIINSDPSEGTSYNITAGRTGQNNGDFVIRNTTTGVNNLFFNRTNGAATFSSSVTASGGKSQFVASGGASAGAGISLNNGLSGSGRRNWFIGTEESVEGDFQIKCSTAAGGVGGSGDTRLAILNNGNVGIGTASPGERLEVVGNIVVSGADRSIYNSSTNALIFGTNNAERMRITSGGHVLINRTNISSAALAGSATLQVNNEFISTGTNAGLFWENRSGGVTTSSNWYGWYTTAGTIFLYNGSANAASINPSTGAYTALSDENKKKDFEESSIGLNEVLNLKPTLYRMKDDESEGEKELGFIAQEVKEFIPQAYVEGGEEDAKFIGLNYNAIVAALVKSVQELKAEIDSLKTK